MASSWILFFSYFLILFYNLRLDFRIDENFSKGKPDILD